MTVGVIVAPLLIAGLLARRPVPRMDAGPVVPVAKSQHAAEGLWGDLPLRTTWSAEGERLTVRIEATADLTLPDLLLYYASSTIEGASLPQDVRLLGALEGARPSTVVLPAGGEGSLVLYSLAHHEIVAHVPAALFSAGRES
ncbi:MAG: hypothetical protein GY716_20460 [bacterium]|nr:hypothetical protein [bacterium]